jgi:hypothetical protein
MVEIFTIQVTMKEQMLARTVCNLLLAEEYIEAVRLFTVADTLGFGRHPT